MTLLTPPLPDHPFDQRSFRDIREAIQADAALATAIQRVLFPDSVLAAPTRSVAPPPTSGIVAVEVSISDNGSKPPPKDNRKDRAGARWHLTIQIFNRSSKGLTDPEWKGFCRLMTPERAQSEAIRLTNPKRCRTPFSSRFAVDLAQVADVADTNGWMVGFVYSKPRDGGTFYHEGFIVLVADPALGAPSECRIMHVQGPKVTMIDLPVFDTKTSTGKPLPRTFVYQSRGATSSDQYLDWRTGEFSIGRM